jgi:hypothetical protein
LKGRALAQRLPNPDAAAVQFDDLIGDGEAGAGAALGLRVGAVDLVELLEDAGLVFKRNWVPTPTGSSSPASRRSATPSSAKGKRHPLPRVGDQEFGAKKDRRV